MEDHSINRDLREPRYEEEDVSPTTDREVKGFYTYSMAAEVFAVCGVGMYDQLNVPFCSNHNRRLLSPSHFRAASPRAGCTLV